MMNNFLIERVGTTNGNWSQRLKDCIAINCDLFESAL